MSFCMNSFKYGIFVVNLIFFILGIFLFYNSYDYLHNPLLEIDSIDKTFIYLCLFISATVILISFLGCCGTCYENSCMIKSYAFLILLCIVLQVSVFFMISRIDTNKLGNILKKELIEKYDDIKPELKEFINVLQFNNKCCGIDGSKDYKDLTKLPPSCCGLSEHETCNKSKAYTNGCKLTIENMFVANKKTFYIVLGLTLGIQLLTVIFSCVLSKNIREQYNVV